MPSILNWYASSRARCSFAKATRLCEPPIILEIQVGVASIALNRADKGNALDLELVRELSRAMQLCESDTSLRAADHSRNSGRRRIHCVEPCGQRQCPRS